MKEMHQTSNDVSSNTIIRKDWIDLANTEDNPKIDTKVLIEFNKLIKPLKDVLNMPNGADYNLSHPLEASNIRIAACRTSKRMNS